MAEIYTKKILVIGDYEYSAGDMIPHIKWQLDEDTVNELHDCVILDVREDSILIEDTQGYVIGGNINEILIAVSNIVGEE